MPYNFSFDRDFVHGGGFYNNGTTNHYIGDDVADTYGLATVSADYKGGIVLNSQNITISNSYISNIHGGN